MRIWDIIEHGTPGQRFRIVEPMATSWKGVVIEVKELKHTDPSRTTRAIIFVQRPIGNNREIVSLCGVVIESEWELVAEYFRMGAGG